MNLINMLRSFKFAMKGIMVLLRTENNAKFHLLAAIMVILMGSYFQINNTEWCLVILAIGLVLAAEAFNAAIEKLCDFVSPAQNQLIGKVKDLAAGAVLIVAIAAALIGCFVFIPKLLDSFS